MSCRLVYSMWKMMADKALMTMVEAYVSSTNIDPSDNRSKVPPTVLSLLHEGVGLNTTGSVFVPQAIEKGRDPTPSELHLHIHTHTHDEKSFIPAAPDANIDEVHGSRMMMNKLSNLREF